ncbi:MAG TPA: PilZ domain-containing protein [Candidatus Acidoferrales bacterium]|nr:PilZ domain-containing protein [Candidatus Acidoferrales bacterium]
MPTARLVARSKLHPASQSSNPHASNVTESHESISDSANRLAPDLWPLAGDQPHIARAAVPRLVERRAYARAKLRLPLRILRIAGSRDTQACAFLTVDISSSGLLAHIPFKIAADTPVDLEISVLHGTMARCCVHMVTQAHVVRVAPSAKPGWLALAFHFDDITFERASLPPRRFMPS